MELIFELEGGVLVSGSAGTNNSAPPQHVQQQQQQERKPTADVASKPAAAQPQQQQQAPKNEKRTSQTNIAPVEQPQPTSTINNTAAGRTCPSCGASLSAKARFCQTCGAQTPLDNNKGNKGKKQQQQQQPQQQPQQPPQQPPQPQQQPQPEQRKSVTLEPNDDICASCGGELSGQVAKALGKLWHKNCLSCATCHKSLLDTSFVANSSGQPVCVDCFDARNLKQCHKCGKPIRTAYMEAGDTFWHRECFKCENCEKDLVQIKEYWMKEGSVYCGDCAK